MNAAPLATGGMAPRLLPLSAAPPAFLSFVEQQWRADEANLIRKIGFWIMLAFFFVRFSLIGEVLTFGLGFRPFLVVILGPLAALAVVLSGGLPRALYEKPGRLLIGFMIWLLVAAPFSVWKGGTLIALRSAFLTEFSMFFMVTGLAVTMADFRWVSWAIALSGLVNVAAVLEFGQAVAGRLAMAFGTLSNPNDLAIHLLVILPFVLLTLYGAGVFSAWRMVGSGAVLASLYTVFMTGSRMALLALAAVTVFILIRSTPLQRIFLVGSISISGILALLVLPEATIQRYLATFGDQPEEIADYEEYLRSAGSRQARVQLLESSVSLTVKNPLFGVGPGQFSVSDADAAEQAGRRATWQVTHNTYTQVSSEAGIPALVFFAGSLIASLWMVGGVYRRALLHPEARSLAHAAFYLMLSLLGYSVCILFASMAYRFYASALVGLTCVFLRAARRELSQFEQQPVASLAGERRASR